jgi:hypothetical protein
MLGTFQQTTLRVEVNAPTEVIRDSLLQPRQFRTWLWPQSFSPGMPDILETGTLFTGYLGPIKIQHQVIEVTSQSLRLLLWEGIDGFQEWHWGHEWVQSRIEGVTLLPLNLAQSLTLLRLQNFLAGKYPTHEIS